MRSERRTLTFMEPAQPVASLEDLKALLSLKTVRLRLLKIAFNRVHSVADAEDLVSEVTGLLLGGGAPWRPDPARLVQDQLDAFVVHCGLVIRRVHSHKINSASVRREIGSIDDAEDDAEDTVIDSRPNVEEAIIEAEWEELFERRATVWTEALCARMKDDSDALQVIEQYRLGRYEAQEQADALGWPRHRLTLAGQRISYHAPKVMAEELKLEQKKEEQMFQAAHAARKERWLH